MLKLIENRPLVRSKLAPSQKKQVVEALENPVQSMRALVKSHLFFFIQYFWDTYSNDEFVSNWHIEYECRQLEEVAYRVAAQKDKIDLILNQPPGTTKTATASIFFPVWCWVNWHWMKFITSSHSKDLSLESAEYSRDIIRSEKFQMMFPDLDVRQDKDVKSNFRVVKKDYHIPGHAPRIYQGGGRVSTSVGARIIGFHAHIIIPDDIIDPKRAVSEVGLKDAQDHMKTLATRKTNKRVSTTILIMQRLHQDDPTGYLLKKLKKNIIHVCLPGMLSDGYDKFVNPPELKEFYINGLLDINRLGENELKELEDDLGQYGFAGQVGQNPTPPEGGMFKPDRMPILDHLTSDTNILATVRYWDKAGTEGGGKRTAGVKMSVMRNGKFVIHDVVKGHWSTENREAVIQANTEADGQNVRVGIEQEGGSGGKESAEGTIRGLAGFRVFADHPTGDKVFRADPFSVQVNNGNVILIRGDWNQEFKDELAMFPMGTYKDQVDAAAGAFNMLTRKKAVRRVR